MASVPPTRLLYRGLGGDLVLPDHFWRSSRQPRIEFIIRAGGRAAAEAAVGALKRCLVRQTAKSPAGSSAGWLGTLKVDRPPQSDAAKRRGSVAAAAGLEVRVRVVSEPRVVGEDVRMAVELPQEEERPAGAKAARDRLAQAVLECCTTAIRGCAGAELRPARPLDLLVEETPGDFLGGVEFGLLSLTTERSTAMCYGIKDVGRRGVLFEVQVGRVDIGASIAFLSQYPAENEYLLPPLSCLEVIGTPRLDATADGEVVVVPLRVNSNLKTPTVDDLVARRKRLHSAATMNLREELVRGADEAEEALARTLTLRRRGGMEQLRGAKGNVNLHYDDGAMRADFVGSRWVTLYAPLLRVSTGKVYFEVTVLSAEPRATLSAGFAGPQFRGGVKGEMGDDNASWGVYSSGLCRHANRQLKFTNSRLSQQWLAAGAVLGVAVDLDQGEMRAFVRPEREKSNTNESSKTWEVVYESGVGPGKAVGGWLFPVLAGGWGVKVEYNLGQQRMKLDGPGPEYVPVAKAASLEGLYGESERAKTQEVRASCLVLDSLDVGRAGLLAEFDAVRDRHEMRAAEDYTSDDVYKRSLNEILEVKNCIEHKREAIVELLEAGAEPGQLQVVRKAPPKDFLNVGKLEDALVKGQDYTWPLLFSGWLRFIKEARVPTNFPPSIIALVWRAVLDAAVLESPGDSHMLVCVGGVEEPRIKLAELIPALRLRSSVLHERRFESAVVGLVLATTQQDSQEVDGSALRTLRVADFRGSDFSFAALLDLARAVVVGRLGGLLREVNGLVVQRPMKGQNLKSCVRRTPDREARVGEAETTTAPYTRDSCDLVGEEDRVIESMKAEERLGQRLTPVDWGFVTAEAACCQWTVLDISSNDLKCLDAKGIAVGLGEITTLTDLDISHNLVGPEGTTALGEVMPALKQLVRLAMGNNNIGTEGAAAVTAGLMHLHDLRFLGMRSNLIGSTGAAHIFDALSGLTSLAILDLEDNAIDKGVKAASTRLRNSPTLSVVNLSGQDVGDEAWDLVAALVPRTCSISIAFGVFTAVPADPPPFRRVCSAGSTIDIHVAVQENEHNASGVGDDSHKEWASAVYLPRRAPLDSDGASRLCRILGREIVSGLKSLELSLNQLGSDGASALAKELSRLTSLTNLGLAYNDIEFEGAKKIAAGLTALLDLRSLSLQGNCIGADGWKEVTIGLSKLENLSSLNGWNLYESLHSGGVTELLLGGQELAAAVSCLFHHSVESLTVLDVSSNELGLGRRGQAHADKAAVQVLEDIGSLHNLSTLSLANNSLGQQGGTVLGNVLERLVRLESLDLSRCNLGSKGASSVAQGLCRITGLQRLMLAGNGICKGANDVCAVFSSLLELNELDISNNKLGPEGGATLASSLKFLSAIVRLDVSNNLLGADGESMLAKQLGSFARLAELNLRGNTLGPIGSCAVLDCLAAASATVPFLHLVKLNLHDNYMGKIAALQAATSLAVLSSLVELVLSRNDLRSEGCNAITSALERHSMLRLLDFGENQIGLDGESAHLEGLAKAVKLETLLLNDNFLGASGIFAAFSVLAQLTLLKTLDLRDNALKEEGGTALGECLSLLTALETLDLDCNKLGAVGGAAAARAAAKLPGLKALNMRENCLGAPGTQMISACLTHLKSLHLDLRWNDLEKHCGRKVPLASPSRLINSAASCLQSLSFRRLVNTLNETETRGWLRKLNRGHLGAIHSDENWRERHCWVSNGRFQYESAKKKGEAELVAMLDDIVQVRPLPADWLSGHWIFRVDIRAAGSVVTDTDTTSPRPPVGKYSVFFSACSVEERKRWIAVLTKPNRRLSLSLNSIEAED